MRRARRTLALLTVLGLAACGTTLTGYSFLTRARYAAPLSGFRVEVVASGSVPAGADLSEGGTGFARVCPTGPDGQELLLRLDPSWHAMDSEGRLGAALFQAGYTSEPVEVAELARAFSGALYGPKGTLMEGQAKSLEVIEVVLDRTAPAIAPAPAACDPASP